MKCTALIVLFVLLPFGSLCRCASGQTAGGDQANAGQSREVSFATDDGGRVVATLTGQGEHAVVLAHGAAFNKESWGEQAELLSKQGLRVLAIDFRGYGKSEAGTRPKERHLDVLAAIGYLRTQGAKRVSVIGGSMGGGAAAQAAVESKVGEIDRLILLAHVPITRPQDLKGRKLFIVSASDSLTSSVKQQYEAAPPPKNLVLLPGSAHAQHIFRTDQAGPLMEHIVKWLKEPDENTVGR